MHCGISDIYMVCIPFYYYFVRRNKTHAIKASSRSSLNELVLIFFIRRAFFPLSLRNTQKVCLRASVVDVTYRSMMQSVIASYRRFFSRATLITSGGIFACGTEIRRETLTRNWQKLTLIRIAEEKSSLRTLLPSRV